MREWRKELPGQKSCINARDPLWRVLRSGQSANEVCRFAAVARASVRLIVPMQRVRGQHADSAMDGKGLKHEGHEEREKEQLEYKTA